MIERLGFYFFLAVVLFLSGWYAGLHQDAFWSWSAGVGHYWQAKFNQEPICPVGYTCQKVGQ